MTDLEWDKLDKKTGIKKIKTEFGKLLDKMEEGKGIFTLGHSNHTIEKFIDLAKSQNIDMVIDVRLYPRSKYNPQYNKEDFAHSLQNVGIEYVYSRVLGGNEWSETDMVQFKKTIERVIQKSKEQRVCLVCSEGDPFPNKWLDTGCHRWGKLTRYILENYPNENVFHITKDYLVHEGKLDEYKFFDDNGFPIKKQVSLDF